MEAVIIVTVLILLQYTFFGVQVGKARAATGTGVPASTGPAEFEIANRIHLNTQEQLVMFLPAMWMFAFYVKPLWAAGFGVIFLVGRFFFRAAYLKDPSKRAPGFMITFLSSAVMLGWLLVQSIMSYF